MFGIGTIRTRDMTKTVVQRGNAMWDVSTLLAQEIAHVDDLFADWDANIDKIAAAIEDKSADVFVNSIEGYECPIHSPRKVICVGINYNDHIAEMGVNAPEFPYSFMRPPLCLTGHNEVVELPDGPAMIDWEAELGVVIGKSARNLTSVNALDAVAGYTIVNDVSARDWIESAPFVGVDWVMQKAWDKFQPTGPMLVPARFVSDPQNLDLELRVNEVVKQKQSTSQMVFSVTDILVHLSKIFTLEPGDIIATGTPAGVGFGRKPREFLKKGDEVTVEISGPDIHLGLLRNTFD